MRNVLATAVVICLLVASGWFLFIHRPAQIEQEELLQKIEAAQDSLSDFRKTVADIPEVIKTSEMLEASRNDLASSLYAKSDIVRLFDDIAETVARYNLELKAITPPVEELLELNEKVLNPAEPLFLNVTLTVRGNFLDFGRYVWTLEQSSFFRGINRCVVRSGAARDRSVTYDIGFRALLGGETKRS